VLPAYNEEQVLPLTMERFSYALPQVAGALDLDFELVFVNDGSDDRTAELLDQFSAVNPHVRIVHLARNFGHQAAVSAGLNVAAGDVVAIMDCDLQDPPEVLPNFLAKWREGNQVVYAVRRKRKEWFGKRAAYWAFYRLLWAVSEIDIPLDSGDFCVMDRSALDLLNSLPERQRFVRGLRTWVGLKQVGVEYERDGRAAGGPKYTFRRLVRLAMDGLVGFSGAPLRLVTHLGILTLCITLLMLGWIILDSVCGLTNAPRGWASTICVMLFVNSVQMISLGVIGEYLIRIFLEVKGRPTFLIGSIVERGQRVMPNPRGNSSCGQNPSFMSGDEVPAVRRDAA
jgi:dolichol-phosphate mannosyltransferase